MAHILIIDDKPGDRKRMERALLDAGNSVAVAADETTAMEALRARKTDLALLDLALPRKSGSTTLIRLATEHANVRVLVTARGPETISTRGYLEVADEKGTVRTLPKPFTSNQLLRAVDVMLGVRRSQPEAR